MIEALGVDHLLLPSLVNRALAANDRVKYLLTLLQTARAAADGATEITNLREERLASGVDDAELDRVVGRQHPRAHGFYRVPGAERLGRQAIAEARTMLAPLTAADARAARTLGERVEAISAALTAQGDLIGSEEITLLSAGRWGGGDSLHLVVMDAHRS